MADKKGLSDVITTVLIIVLALAAVAIIGAVVMNNVRKAGSTADALSVCQGVNFVYNDCRVSGGALNVKMTQNGDAKPARVYAIWYDGNGKAIGSSVANKYDIPAALQRYVSQDAQVVTAGVAPEAVQVKFVHVVSSNGKDYDCPVPTLPISCSSTPPDLSPPNNFRLSSDPWTGACRGGATSLSLSWDRAAYGDGYKINTQLSSTNDANYQNSLPEVNINGLDTLSGTVNNVPAGQRVKVSIKAYRNNPQSESGLASLITKCSHMDLDNNVYVEAYDSAGIHLSKKSFTVSVWLKPRDTTQAWQDILGKMSVPNYYGFSIGFTPGGYVALYRSSSGTYDISSGVLPQSGVWTHIAQVVDCTNGKNKIYVDGDMKGEIAIPVGCVDIPEETLLLGKTYGWGQYKGYIDEFRLYEGALSDGEIRSIKDSGKDGEVTVPSQNLRIWYGFDMGTQFGAEQEGIGAGMNISNKGSPANPSTYKGKVYRA